jgi:RNA polymerase sigma-70 factor (ECF subfamily)
LIRRVAEGDQAALADLYDLTSPVVFGLSMKVLEDSSDAEESTLEVYQQVWNRAPDYDPERGSLLAWLVTMARSRAIDRLRVSRRWTAAKVPLDADVHDNDDGPVEVLIIRERQDTVRHAVGMLKPQQRQVLEAAYFGGLSQSETAERLGIPLGTVKTRIRAAMVELREQLRGLERTT